MVYSSLIGLLSVLAAGQTQESEPRVVGRLDRVANRPVQIELPESFAQIRSAIADAFGEKISMDGLAEECAFAAPPLVLPAFAIEEGETFTEAVADFEAISRGRYVFREIAGLPVFTPNPQSAAYRNLLDVQVSLDLKDLSIWDALCELARAINRSEHVRATRNSLVIMPLGPALLKLPPEELMSPRATWSQINSPAREALCNILGQANCSVSYSYSCNGTDSDLVTILAFDTEGKVLQGPMFKDQENLQYWTDTKMRELQGIAKF